MKRFAINLGLLVTGLATIFTGFLIQVRYHMGHMGQIAEQEQVLGFDYHDWSNLHKAAIVVLSVLILFHFAQHRKWYTQVFRIRLTSRSTQVLILTVLFVLVAASGLIPWFIDLAEGSSRLRKVFIEFHDKLTILLTIFLLWHIIKRLNWYFRVFRQPKG